MYICNTKNNDMKQIMTRAELARTIYSDYEGVMIDRMVKLFLRMDEEPFQSMINRSLNCRLELIRKFTYIINY